MALDIKHTLGLRIRTARLGKKLTQEQLAEMIGKSVQALSTIERGRSLPTFDTLLKLAEALDTPLHMLLAEAPATSPRREQKEFEALLILRRLSEPDLDMAVAQLRAIAERR